MEQEAKPRRVLDKDFDKVAAFINKEYESRKTSDFRKKMERKWKEVDRQVEMEPPQRVSPDGRPIKGDWTSALELGELAKASEIITADVMRISFGNENWFEPHVELDGEMDPQTGKYKVEDGQQEKADGVLRSLMVQQHKDFGLKDRVELAVKEALHHGSLAAEVRWEQQMISDGSKVRTIGSPVPVPYSMWNVYPDNSPSVLGTNMFYTGSMILLDYMNLNTLKGQKGEGWIQKNLKKVKKSEEKDKGNDVCLVKYYGDIVLDRQDGDMYLPNMKAIIADKILVYIAPNDLPYPSVIFTGYERQDVRNPYYTSPIIKQSPMQKLTTVLANEFVDGIRLRTKPPVEYDANDPDYVANGGPDISPGAKSGTKSMGKGMKILETGDPGPALTGMTFGFQQLQEGLGVSSLRQGTQTSDRQTATEAKLMEQGSEVRTIDFINKVERHLLRPFLYMQHELNRKNLKEYYAYSNEMGTPDFLRFTGKDIDVTAHFDVVGARGILGEKERQQNISNVTVFASQSPLFAPLLKSERIILDMYRDAGKRNPEEWVKTPEDGPQIPAEVQQQMQQMQQVIGQLQQELQKAKMGLEADMARIELDKQKAAADIQIKQAELAIKQRQAEQSKMADRADMMLEVEKATKELALERERMAGEYQLRQQEIAADFKAEVMKIEANHHAKMCEMEGKMEMMEKKNKTRKAKIRRTETGYEVEED